MRGILAVCLVMLMVQLLPGHAAESGGKTAAPQTAETLMPIVRIPPVFPEDAPKSLRTGWVLIEFTLTAKGGVENPRVVGSSHDIFEAEALRVVRRWKFRPRKIDGEPVATEGVRTRVTFARKRTEPKAKTVELTTVRLPSGRSVQIAPARFHIVREKRYGKGPDRKLLSTAKTVRFVYQVIRPPRTERAELAQIAQELVDHHIAGVIPKFEARSGERVTAGIVAFVIKPKKSFIPGPGPGTASDVIEFRFNLSPGGNWRMEK